MPTLKPLSGEVNNTYNNLTDQVHPPMATWSSECLGPALLKTSTLPLQMSTFVGHTRTTPSHGGPIVDQTWLCSIKAWKQVSCGVTWLLVTDPLGPGGLQGGTSLDQTCSGSAHRRMIWWDLEILESRLMLFITFLSSFCSEAEHTVLLGGPLASWIVYTGFEWVMVCVKC